MGLVAADGSAATGLIFVLASSLGLSLLEGRKLLVLVAAVLVNADAHQGIVALAHGLKLDLVCLAQVHEEKGRPEKDHTGNSQGHVGSLGVLGLLGLDRDIALEFRDLDLEMIAGLLVIPVLVLGNGDRRSSGAADKEKAAQGDRHGLLQIGSHR